MSWRTVWRKLTSQGAKKLSKPQSKSKPPQLSTDLQKNKVFLQEILQDCGDVSFHDFHFSPSQTKALLLYQQGLVDKKSINESILQPLMDMKTKFPSDIAVLGDSLIHFAGQEATNEIHSIIDCVFTGQTALLVDGINQALLLDTISWDKRSIDEPKTEVAVRGPREGFIESLQTNLGLIRRRIKDSRLKVLYYPMGRRSKTKVALLYMDKLTPPDLLQEVQNRFERVDMDIILDAGYIEQMIEDKWTTIFPQMQLTERPDEVAAGLAEGRVAIMIDTSPGVLIAPSTLNTLMHSSDDYYSRWIIGSFIRGFRFTASIFSILLPALYVALTSFNPEMLPTQFALSIASSRKNVPFPAFIEAFVLEAFIELIREAGIRLPGNLGQAISIVGGLIIGQAAVSAGLVSPVMLTVVGLTAISNFTIPNFDAGQAIRVIRFLFLVLAAFLGLYGMSLGIILVFSHLCMLKTFGYSYLSPWSPLEPQDLKDSIIRLPWPVMRRRPRYLEPMESNRLDDEQRDSYLRSNDE
jgi:spore germination protein